MLLQAVLHARNIKFRLTVWTVSLCETEKHDHLISPCSLLASERANRTLASLLCP